MLQNGSYRLNEDRILLNSVTQACQLKNYQITTRFPIKKGLLNMLMDQLGNIFDKQPYLLILYQAIFITLYFGLFRIGELTAASGNHVVLAKDVHIGRDKNKLMFMLHTSKTHTKGHKPQIIKISETRCFQSTAATSQQTTHYRYCPFKMIKNYIDIRKHQVRDNEQFFVFADRSPVSANQLRTTLKSAIRSTGLNPDPYCVHGMHVAHSSDLLAAGVSVETIKKLSRWKSNSVYTYLKFEHNYSV